MFVETSSAPIKILQLASASIDANDLTRHAKIVTLCEIRLFGVNTTG
jgi:hypothetical protein